MQTALSGNKVAPVLVFGYGNPSRGDDALGPRLVEALQGGTFGAAHSAVEFLTDFQLQIEHALDLAGRRLVLFADAHVTCDAPYLFQRLDEARDDSYTTHAMSPAAVLHVYRRVCRENPPAVFLLSLRGERFELGEALSRPAAIHLAEAIQFSGDLLSRPEIEYWQSLATM